MGTANHDKLPPMGDSSTHVNTIEILYAQGEIHTALVRSAPSSATCSSGVIIVNDDSRFFFLKKKARKNEAIYQQERDLFPHQKSLTATAFIFISFSFLFFSFHFPAAAKKDSTALSRSVGVTWSQTKSNATVAEARRRRSQRGYDHIRHFIAIQRRLSVTTASSIMERLIGVLRQHRS